MDTTIINSNREEELFARAGQNWDLASIYEQVEAVKQELFSEKQLTDLQKTVLRGLLCNYSPEQISTQFPQGMHQPLINITWNLHKCVKHIVGIDSNTVESYRDIPRWLAIAGFKRQTEFAAPTRPQAVATQPTIPQVTIVPDSDDRPNGNSASEPESRSLSSCRQAIGIDGIKANISTSRRSSCRSGNRCNYP